MSQVSLSAQYLASARPSGAAPPSSSGTPRPVPNSSGNLSQAAARQPYRPNINVPKRSNDDVFAKTKVPQTPATSSSQVGNDSISGSGAEKKKKEDSLRGTMRNESKFVECIFCSHSPDTVEPVAKLMYGAGDVADPDIDTVDYMEDMVVEFLSDLVSIARVADQLCFVALTKRLVSVDQCLPSDQILLNLISLYLSLAKLCATASPLPLCFTSTSRVLTIWFTWPMS